MWQLAELEVLSCRRLNRNELSSEAISAINDSISSRSDTTARGKNHLEHQKHQDHQSKSSEHRGKEGSSRDDSVFECEIRLITGRTHQIRLQFAALGAALIGDSRYSPVQGLLDNSDETSDMDFAGVVDVIGDSWINKKKGVEVRKRTGNSREGNDGAESNRERTDGIESGRSSHGDGAHLMGPEPKR